MKKFKEIKKDWQIFDEKEKVLRKKYPKFSEVSEQFYHWRNKSPYNTTFHCLVRSFVDIFDGAKKKLRKNLTEEAYDLYVEKPDMLDSNIVNAGTFYKYLLRRI